MVSQGCPPQPRLRAVRPRCLLCRGVRSTPEPLQIGKVASQGRCTRAPTRTTQPQHLAGLPAQEVAIATIIDIFSLANRYPLHNGTGSLIKVKNTVTLTVGSTDVIKQEQNGNSEKAFSCSAKAAAMSSSKNTVKLNSNYNLAAAKVVLKALTIQY